MSMRICLRICAVLILATLTGCNHEMSGNYLGTFPNGLCWLQIVSTPDRRITGQYETAVLDADGKVDRHESAVTGASDGKNVTISATVMGVSVLALSGTLDGNTLTLTGGQPSPMTLTRSDMSGYRSAVNTLNAKSRNILATKANNELIAKMDNVASRMRAFDDEAQTQLSRIPTAEQNLHAITTKVSEYVNREKQLVGNPNASVARGQLDVAAYQASIATSQLHNSAQALESALANNDRTISSEVDGFARWCGGAGLLDLMPPQIQARNSACDRLSKAVPPYKARLEELTRRLSQFEQVYAVERDTQEALLHTADRLE